MIWNAVHALGWLPLAFLPVMIYYWMRRHPVVYSWGAQYVLNRALRKLKRKLINEHMLLLALRVLLALLLILAFARPALKGRADDRLRHSGVHRVVVLDASASMLAGDAGATRWDAAQNALKALWALWGRGESWSLYGMDDKPGWKVEYAVVGQDQEARAAVSRLRPGERPAALGQAIQEIRNRFALGDVELILLCDDQALTWSDLEQTGIADPPRKTYWLNTPMPSHANTAVTRLTLSSERPLAGHPLRAFADIRHYADEGRDVRVEFLQDGQVVGERRVSLLPGLSEQVCFDLQFDAPGPHVASVRLDPDALAQDDTMAAGLEAVDAISVLVLGSSEAGSYTNTVMLFEAFQEMQEEQAGLGRLSFTFHSGACTAETLRSHEVVFLDASRRVDKVLSAWLTDFIAAGGGLLLAPGYGTDPAAWNRTFGSAKWMPARLGSGPDWKFDPATPEYRRLGIHEFGGDTLRAFASPESGKPGEAIVFHWFDLLYDAAKTDPADILMRFDDHRAFILRKRFGEGQCLLLASGLNGLDNTLPVREIFPALLYRLFGEAAAGQIEPRQFKTGEPIRFRLLKPGETRAVTLAFEGDETRALAIQAGGGAPMAVLAAGLPRSGLAVIQCVQDGGMTEYPIGIQGARADSDLRPLDPAAAASLKTRWPTVEAADPPGLVSAMMKDRQGQEAYPWVLAAALVFLILELLYQKRFTRVIL